MAEKIWSIDRLDVSKEKNGQERVVHGVYWKVEASDEGKTYVYRGHTHLPMDESEDASFRPYESLDQDEIIEWVKEELNKNHIDNEGHPVVDPTHVEWIEEQVDRHLAELIDPPTLDLALPWKAEE